MQRLTVAGGEEPANPWAMGRRDSLLRSLVSDYLLVRQGCLALASEPAAARAELEQLLGDERLPGPLSQLVATFNLIWSPATQPEFADAARLLRLELLKLHASLSMELLGRAAAGRPELGELVARLDTLLLELVQGEAENPLLLRLFLEQPGLSVTLWDKDLAQLFAELFPHTPEAGYLIAAKSYFTAHRLKEALAAYEQALAINPAQEEARRKSYVISGMVRDAAAREGED
ncbi:MAG: hypothetical protein ABFR97_11795 [Thermodesulfobacteriota bacterium]